MTPGAPILMYHRIGAPRRGSIVPGQYVRPNLFAAQMRFLRRRGYQAVGLTEFVAALDNPSGRKVVAITFDDAYRSVSEQGLPILQTHGFKATIFAVAGLVGKTNEWDEQKGDVSEALMSSDELRAALNMGMTIGSHSMTHADLPASGVESLACEVVESKRVLEDELESNVDWFCYPYGYETEKIRSMVKAAGYLGATATRPVLNTKSTDRFALGRVGIRSTTTVPWLIYKLFRAARRTV